MGNRKTYRCWSKKEIHKLWTLSETRTTVQIAKILNRPYQSVKSKMLSDEIKSASETFSLAKAERETGYDTHQLLRAKEALGQAWKRARGHGNNGRYMISHYHLDALTAYLGSETRPSVEDRLWKGVRRLSVPHPFLESPCWIWVSDKQCVGTKEEKLTPQRAAWNIENPNTPKTSKLFNQCGISVCVNPKHQSLNRRVFPWNPGYEALYGLGIRRAAILALFTNVLLLRNGWSVTQMTTSILDGFNSRTGVRCSQLQPKKVSFETKVALLPVLQQWQERRAA